MEVAALGSARTQLGLSAKLRATSGAPREIADRALLHRVAEVTVKDFLERIGPGSTRAFGGTIGPRKVYAVSALPATIFVRGNGSIASRLLGQLDERELAAQLSTLVTQ